MKKKLDEHLREVKWFVQRGAKGFCERDVWDTDNYIARVLGEMIDHLSDTAHGFPDTKYKTYKEWILVLNEASQKFREYVNWEDMCICQTQIVLPNYYDNLGFGEPDDKELPNGCMQFKDSNSIEDQKTYHELQSQYDKEYKALKKWLMKFVLQNWEFLWD